jgi:hypothetical protein
LAWTRVAGAAHLAKAKGGGQGALRGNGGEGEHRRPAVCQLRGLVLLLVAGEQAEGIEAKVARRPVVAVHHVVDLREADGLEGAWWFPPQKEPRPGQKASVRPGEGEGWLLGVQSRASAVVVPLGASRHKVADIDRTAAPTHRKSSSIS